MAVIVAGDLNSTIDMRPFGVCCAMATGCGRAIRAGYAHLPGRLAATALVAIDHVLTRGCTAISLRTIKIPGSADRGLVAR